MDIALLAETLAHGVKAAAALSFQNAQQMLLDAESLSNTVDCDGSWATYEILAVQELQEPFGAKIEMRILASDGEWQMTAYLYIGSTGLVEQAS